MHLPPPAKTMTTYRRRRLIPPVKHCAHAYSMHYTDHAAWCNDCGQTWKWLRKDYPEWFPLPLSEASYGHRHEDSF